MTDPAATTRHGDEGFTLLELTVAFMISAIIAAVMINWLIYVSRADDYEQQSAIALEEMRGAKSDLTKELRFAESVDVGGSDAHQVKFWLDEDGDSAAQLEEIITWRLEPDGTLVRFTEAAPGDIAQRAASLVYADPAAPGSSQFSYDVAFERVTIDLVADVDGTGGPEAKRVRTEVHLRN